MRIWRTRLEGGCMRPLLRAGELATVREVRPEEVSIGDIVSYRRSGRLHLHRVWWRSGGTLWIKDDAAVVGLHRIRAADVRGRLAGRGLLGRGWPGWVYSLAANAAFALARPLKARLRPSSPI